MRKIILQVIYCVIIRNFLRLFIGVKFENSNILMTEEQFIVIANHNSHLDTMAMMAAIPHKLIHKVKPVAAKDYFGRTKFQEKLSNYFINTLLIKRTSSSEKGGDNPIRQMIKELDKGYSLIVFPEGSRGNPEVMQPLKKGIALVLLERPHIKFVPVFMYGMGKALPKGDGIILPFTSIVKFGNAEKINTDSNKDEIILNIEQRLIALKEQ
jgi:1-acyl-sn-glycerol-3-phosphate acyltransferase